MYMYRTGFCHGDVIISLPCLLSAFFFLNNIPPRGNFGTIRKWRQQRGEGRGRDKRKKQKKKNLGYYAALDSADRVGRTLEGTV